MVLRSYSNFCIILHILCNLWTRWSRDASGIIHMLSWRTWDSTIVIYHRMTTTSVPETPLLRPTLALWYTFHTYSGKPVGNLVWSCTIKDRKMAHKRFCSLWYSKNNDLYACRSSQDWFSEWPLAWSDFFPFILPIPLQSKCLHCLFFYFWNWYLR